MLAFTGASANHPGLRLAFSESTQYLGDRSTSPAPTSPAGPHRPARRADRAEHVDGHKRLPRRRQGLRRRPARPFRYVRITLDALPGDAPDAQPSGEVDISGVALDFTGFIGDYTGWFESSEPAAQPVLVRRRLHQRAGDRHLPADRHRAARRRQPEPGRQAGAARRRQTGPRPVRRRHRGVRPHHVPHARRRRRRPQRARRPGRHQRSDGWIPPASINGYTLPLFDYPLWWVTASWDYVLYTATPPTAPSTTRSWPGCWTAGTDGHRLAGLLSRPSGYGDYAFLPRDGEVTYYNALYVLALKDAGQLAKSLGTNADATRWQQRAASVSSAVNANLWDGAATSTRRATARHGQDGNGIAIVAGIASPAQAAQALGHLAGAALPYGKPVHGRQHTGRRRLAAGLRLHVVPGDRGQIPCRAGEFAIDEIKRLYGWMAATTPPHRLGGHRRRWLAL